VHRGHVGADTAGMILAEAPHLNDEMTLLVDVGTNAEIVLGNRKRLLACSVRPGRPSRALRSAPGSAPRRGDRARSDRPRHAGASLQGDRLRPVVR